MMLLGMGLVALAALIVVLFGVYQTSWAAPRRTVLKVGDISFSWGHVQNRVELAVQEGNLTEPAQIVASTVASLKNEAVLIQSAPAEGIEVTEADIDAWIRRRAGVPDDADERIFAQAYRQAVAQSGLSRDEYRQKTKADIIEAKIQEKLGTDQASSGKQAQIKYMVTLSKEKADEAIRRLDAGEDFWAVAQSVEPEINTTEEQSEQWLTPGEATSDIDEFAFSADIGSHNKEPLDVSGGAATAFLVAKVLAREDNREYTPAQQSSLSTKAYSDWLTNASANTAIDDRLSEEDTAELELKAMQAIIAKPTPAPMQIPTVIPPSETTPEGEGTPAEGATPAETPSGESGGQ